MRPIYTRRIKILSYKSWLEKFMRKSYKYHKIYAAKLSIIVMSKKVIHIYVFSNLLKVENYGEKLSLKGKITHCRDRALVFLLARAN